MASGFFAILDDISVLMDDVAGMAKIATKKTAGILGDDLAVNAEKSTGFLASREIPVLWAITKGSFINKLIIVPVTLLLNIFFPVAIKIILVLGGFYLAYEGVEKIVAYLFHRKKPVHVAAVEVIRDDIAAEKAKVKSAIFTDFILSIEIVIIALSATLESSMMVQIFTVSVVSIVATIGVYGIVALIVRMDDIGFQLIKRSGEKGILNSIGVVMVKALPVIIKILAFVGTAALILVSGGIFLHNTAFFQGLFPEIPTILMEFVIGIVTGLIAFGVIEGGKKMFSLFKR